MSTSQDTDFAAIIEPVARNLLGEPNHKLSNGKQLRFGSHGSIAVEIGGDKKGTWFDHEANEGGGTLDLLRSKKNLIVPDAIRWLEDHQFIPKRENEQPKSKFKIVATYDYKDADGTLLFHVVRLDPKDFRQRRPDGTWKTADIKKVPYRLPELLAAPLTTTVYIAEGEKDVDALRQRHLVATCNPGGVGKWKQEYNPYFSARHVIVLSDNDPQAGDTEGKLRFHPDGRPVLPGQDHAADVAKNLRGIATSVRILMLPNLPPKGDVSDWLAAGGTAEELERLAREAPEQVSEKQPDRGTAYGRLLVLGTEDLDTAEDRDYLLKGLLSPSEISIWVGPPKCGKSFLLLYIAYMLSLGRSVFNRRVKPTIVLYVAAEGEGGIAKRIKALRIRYGDSPNFHFIAQPADLLHQGGHLEDMKRAAAGVGAQLIVLDTLSRLMAGGDENAPGDMGMFVCNVTELRHDTSAHIAIIHHGTKSSNGSSPRGHSSLTGADDALIEVIKLDDGSRLATVIHAKDDPDGMRWAFDLEHVELGLDGDADPITTLIVAEKREAAAAASKPAKLSDNEKIAMRCFASAMKARQIMATVGRDHAERPVIRKEDWRDAFNREGMPGEPAHNRTVAFGRVLKSLLAKGLIVTMDDFIWQPDTR